MGRQNAAIAMNKSQFGVGNLAGLGGPSQLMDGLDGMEHAARSTRVRVRQQTAMGVARQLAAQTQLARSRGNARLTALEKADGLELYRQRDREGVIDLRHVDIRSGDPGPRERRC